MRRMAYSRESSGSRSSLAGRGEAASTSGRSGISARRLRLLLSALDLEGATGPGDFLPVDALQAVGEFIGCDEVSFQVMDVRGRSVQAQVDTAPDGLSEDLSHQEDAGLFWAMFEESVACNYPQRTGDHRTVTRLSDFYSRAALRGTIVGEYISQSEFRHELMLPLPPDGPRDERVLLFRGDGSDFTEHDVLVMALLRPHLLALRRRRHARPIPQLTPRQLQILGLVAAGYTNGQVARLLGVASATVRKHLENAFERLEVSSRSAAVVKVMPLLEIRPDSVGA